MSGFKELANAVLVLLNWNTHVEDPWFAMRFVNMVSVVLFYLFFFTKIVFSSNPFIDFKKIISLVCLMARMHI